LIQQKNLLESAQDDISGLAIKSAALDKMWQLLYDRIQATGSPAQIDQATKLTTSSQRIADNIALLNLLITQPAWRSNDKKPSITAPNLAQGFAALQELKTDTLTVNSTLKALMRGDAQAGMSAVSDTTARDRLSEFNAAWQPFERDLDTGSTHLQQILTLKRTSINPFMNNDLLFEKTRAITHAYERLGEIGNMFAIVTGLLALISLVAFGFVTLNESKRRVQLSEAENKRNQEAILRLLNELGDLADGDLTANATVTEDITGAIADSINFTIDELRNLVSGINNATEQLTRTTQQAQSISEHLLNAAKLQSEEIVDTSTAMQDMSRSINDVSASANQSANVAVQSLEAAEKGAEAVENAIIGMNSIRENIQETSKRIKRLGESSQEIGEIVELISDITEQTNVLALNAAIQAAAAGEAGRGFSVVAEEVQRLAERSGQATKQIAALVKTIQTDTQDAVSAMETSTQGVVEGARLSDAAGKTLHDIERVSRELAELIRSISIATDNQASTANKVAQAMQQIQNITEQTTAGTQETASSVGELSALASDLKKSVSGFKLA
jgi:twitching motility protein PilJ